MNPYIAGICILELVYRAQSRGSLTTGGIVAATLTAVVHALHPWSVFFVLLVVFYLAGNAVTKVNHDKKSTLTLSSAGGTHTSGQPEPRTATQVFANSLCATVLIALHTLHLRYTSTLPALGSATAAAASAAVTCLPPPRIWTTSSALFILPVLGAIANYAAVCADTFSSELGILAKEDPVLLTALPVRRVPRGTNGGVTALGLLAGLAGGALIAFVSMALMPFCAGSVGSWRWGELVAAIAAVAVWGALGSLVDSLLGGLLQRSVVDARSGRVVEGVGGGKVLVGTEMGKKEQARKVLSGWDVLSNNGVNFVMALLMSIGAMGVGVWGFGVTW